jgi:Rab GDP dissociation inhibitor
MALQPDDSYLSRPAIHTVKAIRLYAESVIRYGKSAFLYPVYGLGGLPEGFSRLCAIHGGTFILNKGVEEVLFNDDGTVAGVRSGSGDDAEVALAPLVIGDPSYFEPARVKKVGRVIRTVCVIDHPVKGLEVPDSGQIILPQHQLKRSNDVYVSIVGPSHQVAAKGRYVAIVSTTVETAKPQEEVNAGLALLAPLVAKFDNIVESFVPVDDGTASRCFITASYDASSHFEATSDEVLDLYRRIMGESLDMNIKADVNTGGD